MTWEDPLKLGRDKNRNHNHKRSIRDEFSDEIPNFMQNVMIADWLSNMALAVIG